MKYKVNNATNRPVGLRFENEIPHRDLPVQPNLYVMLNEVDILYIDSVSTLFQEGILYVEDDELNQKMGYIEKNHNIVSDDELKKIFSLGTSKMKEALQKFNAQHVTDRVISLAKTSDLPASKLNVIKEVFNVDLLEEAGQNIV